MCLHELRLKTLKTWENPFKDKMLEIALYPDIFMITFFFVVFLIVFSCTENLLLCMNGLLLKT